MRKFTRIDAPQFLTENWERWGNRYATNKLNNYGHLFQWATHKGQTVNLLIISKLKEQTQEHCSYCDFHPPGVSDNTIDHFKPKGDSRFYNLAYLWDNLYFCCADCQKIKMEKYHENLLRPDEADFSFERYFFFDFSTGEIQINPDANLIDKSKAEKTIEILNLNHTSRKLSRIKEFRLFVSESNPNINDFAFRFIFDGNTF